MVRIILTYVVPFLLPSALYIAWSWYRARYLAEHAGATPPLERGPWVILLGLGAVLTLGTLAFTALTSGNDAGAKYTPPRLENGRVVPGQLDAQPK